VPETSSSVDAVDRVRRYLEALGRQDWDALEAMLAEHVYRVGPFEDVVRGRRAYRDFLQKVVSELSGYLLQVERIDPVQAPDPADPGDATCWVRLSETVDADGGRLRTEEALEIRVDDGGKISRVSVFTRRSQRAGPEAGG
jgi:ketosteroid isomerase-like protein